MAGDALDHQSVKSSKAMTSTSATTSALATMSNQQTLKSAKSTAMVTVQCVAIVACFTMAMTVEVAMIVLFLMSGPILFLNELATFSKHCLSYLLLVGKPDSTTCVISGKTESNQELYNMN